MAELIDTPAQIQQKAADTSVADGFEAFGKPVPIFRRDAALAHCRAMGLSDTAKATGMIQRMSEAIERDAPYAAMEAGMAYLDLTGTYRVMAVLCTHEAPPVPKPEPMPSAYQLRANIR